MRLKPFTYSPDTLVDMGLAGEHPIELISYVHCEVKSGKVYTAIQIVRATVTVQFGDQLQELDVTRKVNEDSYQRQMWEEEIRKSYEGALHALELEGA